MSELGGAKRFQFIASNLALDFCNTVGGSRGIVEREYLSSPLQYVAWCQQAGILTENQAEACLSRASQEPELAITMVKRAIGLREAIFGIFGPCCANPDPAAADLELLNSELSQALCRLRLTPMQGQPGFVWKWIIESDSLDQPLGPIAHAAAMLLTDAAKLAHVRTCQGDRCGWLFIDSSKNHSRCWCDMRDCGNRAKIRRHRQKQRSSPPADQLQN